MRAFEPMLQFAAILDDVLPYLEVVHAHGYRPSRCIRQEAAFAKPLPNDERGGRHASLARALTRKWFSAEVVEETPHGWNDPNGKPLLKIFADPQSSRVPKFQELLCLGI